MIRPIRKMEATAGTTTHLDIIDKLNEVIDRLNYITDDGRRADPLIGDTIAEFEREVNATMPPKTGLRRK